jgi:hypothetical protein
MLQCPIVTQTASVRAAIAPSSTVIQQRLDTLAANLQGNSNSNCRLIGGSISNLANSFRSGGCQTNPAQCANVFDEIAPLLDQCTQQRSSIIDMATSVALNLTAGSPAGLVMLGVSAFRSILNIFSRRRETEQQQRARAYAAEEREAIESAASCAMLSFYQTSVCTFGSQRNIQSVLNRQMADSAEGPGCPANLVITSPETQVPTIVRNMNNVSNCLDGRNPATELQCFNPPYLAEGEGNNLQRASCLVSAFSSVTETLNNFRSTVIPEYLAMARRLHTRKIRELRDSLQNSDPADLAATGNRNSLIYHCFYGKVARTISSANPERAVTNEELSRQDRDDKDRGLYRDMRREDYNRVRLLAEVNDRDVSRLDETEQICNSIDRCLGSVRGAPTLAQNFGPEDGTISQRMCRGIGRFQQYGNNSLNGRVPAMEMAVAAGGSMGQNCAQSAPTTSGDSTTVLGQ